MMSADEVVVFQFVDAINAGNVEWLADVMADDHRFVDAAGCATVGKGACLNGWARFFVAFPDYENVIERIESRGDEVIMAGRSRSSNPELHGRALWAARVAEGLVAEWRIHDDTPRARRLMGIDVVADLPQRVVDESSVA
jgi:ketosteroid isomerase-like protein